MHILAKDQPDALLPRVQAQGLLLGLFVIPHDLEGLAHGVNVVVLQMLKEVPLPLKLFCTAQPPAWERALCLILELLLMRLELWLGVKAGPTVLVPFQHLAMSRERVLLQLAMVVVGLLAVYAEEVVPITRIPFQFGLTI